jgi:hypothetical protein
MTFIKKVGRMLAYPVLKPAQLIQRKVEQTMMAALLGVVRHALTLVGGMFLTGDDVTQFVGAGMTLIGLAWSVIEKRQRADG